jgi:phosphatidylinositol alpha 1,6-mannosyltransferase
MTFPRVAYFPDSFHEVNGVAHTSRQFEAFARRRNLPFLCVRAGDRPRAVTEDGSVWTLELPRGFLSFALEKDLRFDPAFLRHIPLIGEVLERFQPEVIHITGPSEIGMLGAGLAHHLEMPLAASWHTNVHEYLARRSDWFLRLLPERQSAATAKKIEDLALATAAFFYSGARVLFAPNPELCARLTELTHRPCHLMSRGVDAELFNPSKKPSGSGTKCQGATLQAAEEVYVSGTKCQGTTGEPTQCVGRVPQSHDNFDGALAPAAEPRSGMRPSKTSNRGAAVLGFVGRLSVEKNIALLVDVEKELNQREEKVRFLIVGHGGDEAWLRQHLPRAEFTGVLRGETLAAAYASMDLFVFPSHTDTFGNVVLEALASGVPAIVTPDGGPKTIVRDDVTGRVVVDEEFAPAIAAILASPAQHAAMRTAARAYAEKCSWDAVFESVYAAYETILPQRQQSTLDAFSRGLMSEPELSS